MYIYIYVHMYLFIHVYIHTYLCIYTCMCIHVYIYIYLYIYIRNPVVLFSTPPEPATLNPDNIYILRAHLLCAAKEVPLNSDLGALRDYNNNDRYLYTIKDKDLWGYVYIYICV
jgi:hypothetical protein